MQIPTFLDQLTPHTPLFEDLGISHIQKEQLALYLERLWAANQDLNLVSRKLSPEALVVDHLLDCLTALPYFPETGTIADLGTGGGLPGVALAICRPQAHLLLFEKSPKKRQFLGSLQDICANMDLQGLVEPDSLSGVTLVTARAFKPISVVLEITRAYAQNGGRYLLYKGRRARIDEELDQANLGKLKARIHALPIVGQADERHLIELKL